MSNRTMSKIYSPVQETVIVAGSFRPNGSSALVAGQLTPSRGYRGWSVVRTSAGLFTVTLPDQYAAVISLTATLRLTTLDDLYAQVGAVSGITTGANGTIQIRVLQIDTGALADIASAAGNWVNFCFIFGNTQAAS